MIVGYAILRNYPLKLWHRQQAHFHELVREFQLLVGGSAGSSAAHEVPRRLLEMADMFITRFGSEMDAITRERQAALDAGLTTFDSVVPLPAGVIEIIPPAMEMMREVDDYCRNGDLLTLARPEDVVALQDWSTFEILAQFQGAEPTPWSGPTV